MSDLILLPSFPQNPHFVNIEATTNVTGQVKIKNWCPYCSTLTSTLTGVIENPPPAFPDCKKRRRYVPPFLAHLFMHLFRIVVKISDPGHPRSGHQVTSSDLTSWSLNARYSYTEWLITWKLSVIDIHNSIYKTFISEFWYRWLRSGQFCDLSINLRPSSAVGSICYHPLGFLCITKKPRRVALHRLAELVARQFWTMLEIVDPRSLELQVRSPGHINWPGLKKVSIVSSLKYLSQSWGFKFGGLHASMGTSNLLISEFLYLWPKVRSAPWPLRYKSMEKSENDSS